MAITTSNMESEVRRQYNRPVFFCIRVREAGLLIGLWDLFIHAFGLFMLIYLFQNDPQISKDVKKPDWTTLRRAPLLMMPRFHAEKPSNNLLKDTPFLSSSILLNRMLEKRNLTRIPSDWSFGYYPSNTDLAVMRWATSLKQQDRCIIFFILLSSTVLTLAHIFGIISNKPSYLVPYFLIKVFNLVVSILSMLGFYAYLPDIKLWLLVQPEFPYKQNLLDFDSQSLRLIVFASLILIILAKLYIAAIIWYCYGYITTLNMARHMSIHQLITTHSGFFVDEMYSPPKYDEAIRSQQDEYDADAPPPYTPLLQGSV